MTLTPCCWFISGQPQIRPVCGLQTLKKPDSTQAKHEQYLSRRIGHEHHWCLLCAPENMP